ncbi:hypothetical protein GCM10022402_10340 [Salinactinospora qingdaonensis]|uniref:Tryptophan-associated transmembrane protein (Trp_oprn_chp) n=1 Tax=Salinactinospora qingdaonensis TaxID=702744 RepID=A0ABP7F4V6_9ACTN
MAASAGAGQIHLVMAPSHWSGWWLSGVFFIVIGAFQVLWAVVAAWRGSTALLWLGTLVNLGSIGLWGVSRLYGLPFGAHAGTPEAVGLTDLITVVLEAVVVAGALLATVGRSRSTAVGGGVISAVAVAAVAVAFATAAAVGAADEHGHGASEDESGHHGEEVEPGHHQEEAEQPATSAPGGTASPSPTASAQSSEPAGSDDAGAGDSHDGHDHEH